MSLEGRKFHFTRDEDGKIYAENEIETAIANREGWLLPPRKGERHIVHYRAMLGGEEIEVVYVTTGELKDSYPVCEFAEISGFERKEKENRSLKDCGWPQNTTFMGLPN